MITLVVILTVRRDSIDAFRSFEYRAAAVMSRYGGVIERTVVVPDEDIGLFREIHVVTFPSPDAFVAYRGDEILKTIAHLRETSVVATELMIGEEGPDYSVRR